MIQICRRSELARRPRSRKSWVWRSTGGKDGKESLAPNRPGRAHGGPRLLIGGAAADVGNGAFGAGEDMGVDGEAGRGPAKDRFWRYLFY